MPLAQPLADDSHMRKLQERTLATRSWVVSILVPVLVLMIAFLSLAVLGRQFQLLGQRRDSISYSGAIVAQISLIRDRYLTGSGGVRQYIDSGNAGFLKLVAQARNELPGLLLKLRQTIRTQEDADMLHQLEPLLADNLRIAAATQAEYERNNAITPQVNQLIDKVMDNIERSQEIFAAWREYHLNLIATADAQQKQQLRATTWYALSIGILGAVVALLLSTALKRHMRRRSQLAAQLQLSAELWRGTLDNLLQGVAVYDMQRQLIFWNRQFEQLTGAAPEKLHVGMSYDEFMAVCVPFAEGGVGTLEIGDSDINRLLENQPIQFERQRMDGVILRIELRPISAAYHVLALTDITEIRKSEATAHDQAARLAAIMDNVPDGIMTFNLAGHIESWSAGAQRIFGYEAADVLQQPFNLLLDPTHADAGHDLPQLLQEAGGKLNERRELHARNRDGHSFPIDLVVSEMQIAGTSMWVGIIRDITERCRVEQLKTEFISTVSHELRTPLTSIRGALGLLGGASNELSKQSEQLVSIALQNITRLTRLINDILDLEKAEAGKLTLNLKPVSLAALTQQAIEVNATYAIRHQVRFQLTGADEEHTVLADADRIMQVLTNLLSNAAKFSPAGGEVRVAVQRRGAYVRVVISDQGPGVPASFRTRIFSRFAQAQATESRRQNSSGLGLAIAKSLVERHNGHIGYLAPSEQDAPQGATFWFELPLSAADALARHA